MAYCLPLLPANLHLTALALVLPGTDNRTVLEREVFDLAVEDVVERARLVLHVGFEMHDPAIRVQRRVLDRCIVGSGVEHAGDGFAVPVEDEDDVVAVRLGRSPRAQPRSFQGMPFLRGYEGAADQAGNENGQ